MRPLKELSWVPRSRTSRKKEQCGQSWCSIKVLLMDRGKMENQLIQGGAWVGHFSGLVYQKSSPGRLGKPCSDSLVLLQQKVKGELKTYTCFLSPTSHLRREILEGYWVTTSLCLLMKWGKLQSKSQNTVEPQGTKGSPGMALDQCQVFCPMQRHLQGCSLLILPPATSIYALRVTCFWQRMWSMLVQFCPRSSSRRKDGETSRALLAGMPH